MKVLMIGDFAYVHVRRWAEGISELGVDLSLLSRTEVSLPGVRWCRDRVPPLRPWRPRRWVGRRRRMLREVLDAQRPDVVHLHFPGEYSLFPDDLDDLPLIVSTWGSEVVQASDEGEESRNRKVQILRRADRVIASSEFLAESTRSYGSLDPSNVEVSYWGVDLERFSPPAKSEAGLSLGFAKHLLPVYGLEYLLQAMPQLTAEFPSLRLRVAGDGALKEGLKSLAAELGSSEQVEWCGSLPHQEMPDFFRSLTLSVMPSLSETLGVAALESQATGVPVVATDVGGIPESVLNGRTGLLVPARDSAALARAIGELLRRPSLREEMGLLGREHVEERFDWRQTLSRMLDTYREVQGGR